MINANFNSILDLLKTFPDQQSCIDHLEELKWGGIVVSPFDPESKVYKCKYNRYKCKNTGKYFNVKTGTFLDNTKVPLQKWFLAVWLITSHKKGISSLQLAKDIDVTQKTAWFVLHRIRNCFKVENENQLDNVVECDETYVGGKNKYKHQNKKVKGTQGRSTKDKTPILGMVERGGKVNAKKVEDVKAKTLTPEIVDKVKNTAELFTDEWVGYKSLSKIYDHSFVKHNSNEYVNGRIHTNTIEGFWSLLKRSIIGIYHFTSKKHLQNYVDEMVFRYNTKHQGEAQRFNLMLSNTEFRLKYAQLIGDE